MQGHGDPVRLLGRAIAIAKRRRRYRLGIALLGVTVLTPLIVLGVTLLVSG
jgi:hypothetical protein